MKGTKLLPPSAAIRMVWARTGAFSDDPHSQHSMMLVEAALKDIKEQAKTNPDENEYITSAIAMMDSSLRSMDTVYKGRKLNFDENEKLRLTYLESIKENLNFGKKAKDFVSSLPAMTIGGTSGLTLAHLLKFSELILWTFTLSLAAFGFIINWLIVRSMRNRTQLLYIRQDYERGLYYDQYVKRIGMILTSLYLDLDILHRKVFGQSYPMPNEQINEIVDTMLKGIEPTYCKYVHMHMKENKITPELWAVCESGNTEATESCKYWKAYPPKATAGK